MRLLVPLLAFFVFIGLGSALHQSSSAVHAMIEVNTSTLTSRVDEVHTPTILVAIERSTGCDFSSISVAVDALTRTAAAVKGDVEKAGAPQPQLFDSSAKTKRNQWLLKNSIRETWQWSPESARVRELEIDNIPSVCLWAPESVGQGHGVYVNHQYKFIYIKHAKAGGTTIERAVLEPWLCPVSDGEAFDVNFAKMRVAKGCFEKVWEDPAKFDWSTIEKWWSEYLVFTFVRNPWARLISGVNYVKGFGRVGDKDIHEKCAQGIEHALHNERACNHMQAQTPCMREASGFGWAVDYIGHVEDLDRGLADVHARISRQFPNRTLPPFPPIPTEGSESANTNIMLSEDCKKESSAFEAGGVCREAVARHYSADIRLLEFQA